MKKLKYLLFLFIIFLFPNVFADTTYDLTSRITSPVNFNECGIGSYTGVELNGATNCWNTKTRYQGTLNRIYFNLPAPTGTTFDSDTTYRLSLIMATDDWRNNFGTVVVSPGSSYTNNFVDTFSYVSYKQINITFTVPYSASTTYQTLWVNIPAKSTSHLITGVSNWNLSKVTLTKLTSGSGGGSTTPSGPSTSFDDTAIINNANENTQDVINNNNSNTQDIINNNNSNTTDIIDNQTQNTEDIINNQNKNNDVLDSSLSNLTSLIEGCTNLLSNSMFTHNYYNINGTFITYGDYFGTDLIEINNSNSYYLYNLDNTYRTFVSFFDSNKNYLGRSGSNYISAITINGNTTWANNSTNQWSNTKYIAITHNSSYYLYFLSHTIYLVQGTGKCQNKLDSLNDSINSVGSDIIDSVQDSTNSINENIEKNFNSCSLIDKSNISIENKYLDDTGNFNNYPGWGVTDYIRVNSLEVLQNYNGVASICFYNFNKDLISCIQAQNLVVGNLTLPTNTYYFRASILTRYNQPTFKVCSNSIEKTNEAINDVNNYLKDDTDATIDDSALSDVFGRVHFNDPLSYLLTLPVQLINKIVSMSDTCSPIDFGTLYGVHLTMPCINLENYLGSNLWGILDVILTVSLLAVILKNFYDTVSNLLTLGGEKEAKEKFSMPTPMDFLAMILGGDNR